MTLARRIPFITYRPDEPVGGDGTGTPDPSVTPPEAVPEWAEPPALPFELDSIEDETHREFLRARQAQLESGFGRKIQTVLEREKSLTSLASLEERLKDPATRYAALSELAGQYDVELEFDDVEGGPSTPEPVVTPTDDVPVPASVQATLDELTEFRDRQLAKEDEQSESQRLQTIGAHIRAGLVQFANDEGIEGANVDAIPEVVRDEILARATALPRLANGMPDMETAIAAHLVGRDEIRRLERERILKSKDVPTPDLSTTPADPAPQPTGMSKAQRIERGLAIAGRHS